MGVSGNTPSPETFNTVAAETLSGAVTLSITGDSVSAANDDTVCNAFIVGFDDRNT
jgi:hypothetical protein